MAGAAENAAMSRASTPNLGGPARLPVIPGYEVLERIGQGGMGEVYAARQLALGRMVALKFLALGPGADPDERLDRFRREAELMACVSHPNILAVYDFGAIDDRPYLVMEYVAGGDLRRRIESDAPMGAEQVRAIVGPVCEALACLHRHGILHRDLKPENILMHDEHAPKVADFGIAVLRTGVGSLTQTGHGLGTLGYVAPEQQYGLKVDERADQYSLAAIAYELLTGEKPLGVFKPPSHYIPRLGPRVDAVILQALQEDPAARLPSIQAFGRALDGALAGTRPRPSRSLLGLLAAVAVTAGVVAWLAAVEPAPGTSPESEATVPTKAKDPVDAKPVDLEATQRELVEKQAYLLWIKQGRPKGPAGEAVAMTNWLTAEQLVKEEVNRLAYGLWEAGGRPQGEAGRKAAITNRLAALRILRARLDEAIGREEQRVAPDSGPEPPRTAPPSPTDKVDADSSP
jgi:hypothetical protein